MSKSSFYRKNTSNEGRADFVFYLCSPMAPTSTFSSKYGHFRLRSGNFYYEGSQSDNLKGEITQLLPLSVGTEAVPEELVQDKNNDELYHITEDDFNWYSEYYKVLQECMDKLKYYKDRYETLIEDLVEDFVLYSESDGDEDMRVAKGRLEEIEARIASYNPETSQLLASRDNGLYGNDFDYVKYELYQNEDGDYFIVIKDNRSEYSDIYVVTEEEAKAWAEKYLSGEEYEEIFGEVEE